MNLVKRISEKLSQPKHIPLPFEHRKVQEFLKLSPKIVRASIVENYRDEVRCEVEDTEGVVTHLGNGVNAVGIWFRVISERDGVEIPAGLKNNE
jgi:hypothetical protein